MKHSADILLFGTMGTIGQEVQASLEVHGLEVASVPFVQNVFGDEPGYRRALVQAIAENRPKAVFPIGNPLAMSRFRGLLEQGLQLGDIVNSRKIAPQTEEAVANAIFAVEKEETIRLLDSKANFYELTTSLGLRQPPLFRTADEIPDNTKVVFKRDISFGGHGVHLPRNKEALRNLIAHQSPGEPYLIEEFIEGADYSLDAVRSAGNIYLGGYRCISSKRNGPAEHREPLDRNNPVLVQMKSCAETVMDYLDYHGICGFDFRADNSGRIYMIECNPRFTGGISTQIASGLDLPWLLYRSVIPASVID